MMPNKTGLLNRLVVPAIVLIFAAPILSAWWLLTQADKGTNLNAGNYGQLIVPPRPLQNLDLQDLLRSSLVTPLHGKWTLVFFQKGVCGTECFDTMYKIRQIRLATGEYAPRVQRLMLVEGDFTTEFESELVEQFRGQQLLDTTKTAKAFIQAFDPGPANPGEEKGLYLVDPLGNLMMYYSHDAEPAGVIKDLKRLLRYSRIG